MGNDQCDTSGMSVRANQKECCADAVRCGVGRRNSEIKEAENIRVWRATGPGAWRMTHGLSCSNKIISRKLDIETCKVMKKLRIMLTSLKTSIVYG